MKIKIKLLICMYWLSAVFFYSCDTNQRKSTDAFDRFKVGKNISNDTLNAADVHMLLPQINKPKVVLAARKVEQKSEWVQFKLEMRNTIANNEYKIKEIKKLSNISGKCNRKIRALEKDNKELKSQFYNRMDGAEVKQEKINSKMIREVYKIDTALKNLRAVIEKGAK